MSGRVAGRVFERILGSAPRKAVLLCLAEHSNPDGEMAFPSVYRISQETELGETTVRAALSWLRKQRLIIQTHPAAQHRPPTYRVNLDILPDLPLVEVYRPSENLQAEIPAEVARPPAGAALDSPPSLPGLPLLPSRPPAPAPEPSLNRPSARDKPRAAPPPVITIFRKVTQSYPKKSLWPMLVRRVGADPKALDRWRKVVEEWIAHGYKPHNIDGMLDVFEKGWTRPNGSKPGSSAAHDPAADVARFNARRPAAAAAHTKEPA
jgi:hypothetical protein